MAACPYVEYRQDVDGETFAEPRAFCTAAERFVEPMRADICNDRYELQHDEHCEIYQAVTESDDTDR